MVPFDSNDSKNVLALAKNAGFHRASIIPLRAPQTYSKYQEWLSNGHHGDMNYMNTPQNKNARRDLKNILNNAQSLLVVILAYPKHQVPPAPKEGLLEGNIAKYARGEDYHFVFKKKLRALAEQIAKQFQIEVLSRPCVDTAPILERDFAQQAGIGFWAKNTMIITPGLGSFTLIGELLLDISFSLPPIQTLSRRCGECTRCIDFCPTNAFVAPYSLDSRRCNSYLTIENKGWIPKEFRKAIGNRIFGCDVCQDVCPFNTRAPEKNPFTKEFIPIDRQHAFPDLLKLVQLGTNQRKKFLQYSAMRRINRNQFLRNLCIALGNSHDKRAKAPLLKLARDRSPLVRGHAIWALQQLGEKENLKQIKLTEKEPLVLAEFDN